MNREETKKSEKRYIIECSEHQLKLLSFACERYSRLIQGQDFVYQELMEEAWEKRCKEATGKMMSDDFDTGWYAMRSEAESLCKQIKKRFWGLGSNELFGIHYDDSADVLFDIHKVIRHQLWLERPASEKSFVTVDSDEPWRVGSEKLIEVKPK